MGQTTVKLVESRFEVGLLKVWTHERSSRLGRLESTSISAAIASGRQGRPSRSLVPGRVKQVSQMM